MIVREAKKKIEELSRCERNLIKIQNYFMRDNENESIKNTLEEGADLSMPIRDLCSASARILQDEINRLVNIIDETIVKV